MTAKSCQGRSCFAIHPAATALSLMPAMLWRPQSILNSLSIRSIGSRTTQIVRFTGQGYAGFQ